jgi:hypothetical protein
MNNLSTLKTLFLLIIIVSPFTLRAQNKPPATQKDTSRLILIVMPGKTKPSNTTPYTPANISPSTSESSGVIKATPTSGTPVTTTRTSYAAPTTAERSGTANIVHTSGTSAKTTKTGYAAPTTAERSGTSQYMVPYIQPKKSHEATTKTATPTTSSNSANTSPDQQATVTSIQPATITPVPAAIGSPAGGSITLVKTTPIKVKGEKNDTTKHHEEALSPRTNKILFGEVGGPGLAISLNYDARFGSERNGLGFRIGAGYYGNGGNTVFSVPFQINYLIGSGSNFIELGGGTTFINSTGDNKGKTFIFDRVTGLIGTATIGYRFQSDTRRINFRIGFVPILYDQGIIYAAGLSIGYTFKAN